jgi:hypothetical protein
VQKENSNFGMYEVIVLGKWFGRCEKKVVLRFLEDINKTHYNCAMVDTILQTIIQPCRIFFAKGDVVIIYILKSTRLQKSLLGLQEVHVRKN